MAKKQRIAHALEHAAKDPAVRAVAASTALAASTAVAGKLVHDRAERAHLKAERRYRISPHRSVGHEFKRVLAGQLEKAIEALDDEDVPPEAVHDARKALKRARAALRLHRELLDRPLYRRENRELRDAGRQLSGLRDSQVLLQTLDGLAPDSFGSLRQALAAQARDGSAGAEELEPARSAIQQARGRIAAWPAPDGDAPRDLGPGLERIYRRGRKALRAARRDPDVDRLHELRKRVKDLWHAAQLCQAACPKRARALARRAHDVSNLLGSEHDLALLHQRVREELDWLSPGEREVLEHLISHRRKQLRREALSCAKRLYRRKPRRLRRQLAMA